LVLEFESSRSAELIMQDAFGGTVAVIETFYGEQEEAVWAYSTEYIHNLLAATKFNVAYRVPIHILSPWVLLVSRNVSLAASFARMDRYVRWVPILSLWASNHLLICQKQREESGVSSDSTRRTKSTTSHRIKPPRPA
jgi:hypothetical protein